MRRVSEAGSSQTASRADATPRIGPLIVAAVGLVMTCVYVTAQLAGQGWDPTWFTAFGEEDQATRAFAEERLGEVILRPQLGHDGRFFFVQANDPWVVSPDDHASILDRPLYRAQRMLYPLLAGGFGGFAPDTTTWAMIVVNVLALTAGTWAVADIARQLGGSPWWGLAFLLNVGFAAELNIGGAGILAGAQAFGGVAALLRDRMPIAVLLLTLAALSREVMLIAAAGSALWLWTKHRRRAAVLTGLIPLTAVVAWGFYLRSTIDLLPPPTEVQDSLGLPFVGLARAFQAWASSPLDLAVGVMVILILIVFTRRAMIDRGVVGLAFLGFVPLTFLLSEPVWHSYFDISRAIAPVITAFVLLAFVATKTPAVEEDN